MLLVWESKVSTSMVGEGPEHKRIPDTSEIRRQNRVALHPGLIFIVESLGLGDRRQQREKLRVGTQ